MGCIHHPEAQSQHIPAVRNSLRNGRRQLAWASSSRIEVPAGVFQTAVDKNKKGFTTSSKFNINYTKPAKSSWSQKNEPKRVSPSRGE